MHYYYKTFIYIIIVIVNICVGIIGFQNDLLSSHKEKSNFSKKFVLIEDEKEKETKAIFQIKKEINGFLNNRIIFRNFLSNNECILIKFSNPKNFSLGILPSYSPFELILIGEKNRIEKIILDDISHISEFLSNKKIKTKYILEVHKFSTVIKNIKIGDKITFK